MSTAPSVRRINGPDLSDDWSEAKSSLLLSLNSHISDVNDSLAAGLSLVQNFGAQLLEFTVMVPDDAQTPLILNAWTTQPVYRLDALGNVAVEGVMTGGGAGTDMLSGLPPVRSNILVPTSANSLFGVLIMKTTGILSHSSGSTTNVSVSFTYRAGTSQGYVPLCFPIQIASKIGQASTFLLGSVTDVTTNTTVAMPLGDCNLIAHTINGQKGMAFSVDNITGLLPNHNYKVTAYALPA